MLYTLRDFSQLDLHRKGDSCVVVLLTHGLDGQVCYALVIGCLGTV